MMDDKQLLQAYAREWSESAFGELASRHIDFVYSAALRVVNGDSHLAQDVAQTVFIDLARKAGSLPRDVGLAGWLHHHTCYTAAKAVRTERRRQAREQTAMEMKTLDDNTRPEWELVAPSLDESLNQLNPADRDALVLRFLKQQDLRAVGAALGISDDAARKRVDRALEKLHILLKQRGATLSATALGTALATEAVTAAPAGLAASVAGTALASAAVGGGTTATLVKLMTMTKVNCGIISVIAVALGAGIYEARQTSRLREQNLALQQQQAPLAEQVQQLTRERDAATRQLEPIREENERLHGDTAELLRLRAEVGSLRNASRQLAPGKIGDANDPTAVAAQAWLNRVKLLKQRFEQWPGKKTPELQLLTEQDLINEAANRQLDSDADCRKAMSHLRLNAKGKFASAVNEAMEQFAKANKEQLPSDLSQFCVHTSICAIFIDMFCMPNDGGERPPQTVMVERTRHFRIAARR